MTVASEQVTARDYLNTVFYYRALAVAVFLTVVFLGTTAALMIPPAYKAQATLLTLFAGYYDQSNITNNVPAPQPFEGELASVEAQVLNSPDLHRAAVVAELGVNAPPRLLNAEVARFESHFHLEQDDLSNTINLTYSDSSPQRAANILSSLLTAYFNERATVFTSGRVAFLTGQRDKTLAKLNQTNAALVAFQKAHGIADIDAQIASAVALNALLTQRKLENDDALTQDRSTLASLLVTTADVPSSILIYTDNTEAAHALDTMQLSLLQLEAKRADLASRYMAASPFVAQLDQQISALSGSIAAQNRQLIGAARYGHNTYYDTVQDRLAVLTSSIAGEVARQQELGTQVTVSNSSLQALISISSQLHQMVVDRDILLDSFRDFSHQVELARIEQDQAGTASGTNVRVIQAPFPPAHRSNPPRMIIAASVVAGLMIAVLTVVVVSSLRQTFLSPEQAERSLALPVLSAPISRGTQHWRWPWSRTARHQPPAAAGSVSYPSRMEFSRIIAAIESSSSAASKVALMIAFDDEDALAPIVQGLAVELERRSARPILVVDLVSPPDVQLYGWPPGSGKGTAPAPAVPEEEISQQAFIFRPVEQHNITVAQPRTELFSPARQVATGLFGALRRTHDYVLIYAPPASQSFAGIETASLADAAILTIRAEATRKAAALGLKARLQDAGSKIVGIVLTGRKTYIPDVIYRFL
jgi:uncharacterized protein involved in exopolysaccharide biosynthesis